MEMFCRQCEQTLRNEACVGKVGVCGKGSDVSALQDLLIHALKGIAVFGKMLRDLGIDYVNSDLFIVEGLFTTVTNVNFDPERLEEMIIRAYALKEKAKNLLLEEYKKKNNKPFEGEFPAVALWEPALTMDGLVEQGKMVGFASDENIDQDIKSLREILLFGLKGMAAYADHAYILGKKDEEVIAFFYKGLYALVDTDLTAEDLLNLIMEFGKVNLKCLELLDRAHTEKLGDPEPTKVTIGVKKGPAIIVSGHDLLDLEELLKQAEDSGVNIYTHGEMLPAHAYPGLKKYENLAGHFGSAWQNQQAEFDNIPAAILMTTNCIQKPRDSYKDRIFTTGLVAWPGLDHIGDGKGKKDFGEVIKKAKELGGFNEEKVEKEITIGFAHGTVLKRAGQIVDAVKAKKIRHFFLIGGCDGARPGRNYYTEFAEKAPKDSIILTLACGKFRFNTLDLGYIGDFPRLLDCGQCNDAYSAIKIALALSEAFECSVNELPLSLILSWYEQKAVCILLTLLSLGIKNIRLGPSLPAFVSPNVLKILVDKFNIKPIAAPDADLDEILGSPVK